MRTLYKFIYFKLLGWQLVGNKDFSKNTIKKAVLIAAPHTSWHDFFIGLMLRKIVGVRSNFIGKKELFKGPLGWYLRRVGGAAVNRQANENKVDAIARLFSEHDEFRIALAPEGTRKKVTQWKTGFYFIAKAANVPIIMFTLDFKNKQNKISAPFYPTDDFEADMKTIKAFYKGVEGKIAAYS